MVAEEKEEATTAVVPAVTSEFDALDSCHRRRSWRHGSKERIQEEKEEVAEESSRCSRTKAGTAMCAGGDLGVGSGAVGGDAESRPRGGRGAARKRRGCEGGGLAWVHPAALCGGRGHTAIVDTLLAHGADVKAVDDVWVHPAALGGDEGHSATVDALLKAGADGTAKDKNGKSPADLALENKHPIIVAKCDPALAKAEGEKLRKAFEEATTVHVLSTRFNEPSEEVLAAWYKAKVTSRRRSGIRRQI